MSQVICGSHSGAELQFAMDVERVRCRERSQEDGSLGPWQIFESGQVIFAIFGDFGELSLIDGKKFCGHVEAVLRGEDAIPAVKRRTVQLPVMIDPVAMSDDFAKSTEEAWQEAMAPLPQKPSVPGGFASKVSELVSNRGSDYGTPAENHQLTADLWSAWMSRRLAKEIKFSAEDVCMLNVLQKQSRMAFRTKDDSWFDVVGYAENVAMLPDSHRNNK